MTRSLRIHAQATLELGAAIRWYEAMRVGLGREFLDEVVETVERIESIPEVGSPMSADRRTRRLLVPRFPYQVIYRIRTEEVVLVAFAHLKRQPGYWKQRA